MPVFEKASVSGVSAEALWSWHAAPGAFSRLVPPWQDVEVRVPPDGLRVGGEVDLSQRVGPWWASWVSRITEVRPLEGFVDEAVTSPFAAWRHDHSFVGGRLVDRVTWEPPAGRVGVWVAGRWIDAELGRAFAWRHRVTLEDVERHQRYAAHPRLRVGVTGASGLVGSAVTAFLRSGGHTVVPFVRRGGEGIPWDPAQGVLNPDDLIGLDAVVHLAGESVAQRWTPAARKRIWTSRVDGTRLVANALGACASPPRVLVNASAVGFYGDRREAVDEGSAAGDGYLAEVAQAWEGAASSAPVRTVSLRLGTVLSGRGGALPAMLPAWRAGLGGRMGAGDQPMPWIALDDVVDMVHEALFQPGWTGPVNAVAPEQCSQAEFAAALGAVLGRPACVPVPAFALRLALGEMGQRLLLEGAPVRPARAWELGFAWRRPTLRSALEVELGLGG